MLCNRLIHCVTGGVIKRTMSSAKACSAVLSENGQRFSFSFDLDDDSAKRRFNMDRPVQETVQQFLDRVNNNVEKKTAKKRKKNKNKNKQMDPVKSQLRRESGSPIDESSSMGQLLFNQSDGEIFEFILLDEKYRVEINPPAVKALKLPTSQIMAGFDLYPFRLELERSGVEHSTFTWFVGDGSSWEKRSEGFFFTPGLSDIDCKVKLEVTPRSAEGRAGAPESIVSSGTIGAGPGFCPFENRHKFTRIPEPEDKLRVVSYNLLADLYADSDFSRRELHPQCPAYALAFDYRKQLLLKEVAGYNGDIVCLQEVDKKFFTHDLQMALEQRGMEGRMAQKATSGEGSACFFRKDKFELLENIEARLSHLVESEGHFEDYLKAVNSKEALREDFLRRSTTLQILILRSRSDPRRTVLVANTHLYFRPDADHIRLLQIGVCMTEIQRIRAKILSENQAEKCSIIFCGDFNSCPKSGIPKFMSEGSVNSDYYQWRSCPGQEVEHFDIRHPFEMDSACGYPKYTNFTLGFADCLDYIFYQRDEMGIEEVVPFPSEEELRQHQAIPSVVTPSDHIACVATLKWL